MTITKAKAPQGVFSTTTPIAEGLKIPAGESAYQSVTFTPTAVGQAGTSETYYLITADDGQGALKVMLTGKGTDDPIAAYAWKIGAGDPRSSLGRSLTLEYAVAGGKCQDYVRGVICWSPSDRGPFGTSVRSTSATRPRAVPRACLGFPTTDEKGSPDGVGRYNHFSGCGRVLDLLVADDRGALRPRCDPVQMERRWARRQDRWAIRSRTRSARRTGWGGTTTSPVRAGHSIYWSPTTGAHSIDGCDPGQVGGHWAGRRAWAIRPPTRRRRRTGWGGTTTSRVRVETRSTGRRRPGRTLSSVRSGPSGRHWAGRRARWAIRPRTRRAPRIRWGGTTTSPVRRGIDLLDADYPGALGDRCDPGQVGVARLGDEPAGLSDQRRVLGFRRSGIGLSTRPADLERNKEEGHRIAARGPARTWRVGPHQLALVQDPCRTSDFGGG